MQQITVGHPCNHTSAWVFFCKFVAYFQKTFSQENLWMAAPGSRRQLEWILLGKTLQSRVKLVIQFVALTEWFPSAITLQLQFLIGNVAETFDPTYWGQDVKIYPCLLAGAALLVNPIHRKGYCDFLGSFTTERAMV